MLRTTFDLAVAFSVALEVVFRVVLRVAFGVAFPLGLLSTLLPADRFEVWLTERVRLPRVPCRANEWRVLGLATDRDVVALVVK